MSLGRYILISLNFLKSLDGARFCLFFWPYIFLEFPRYVLTVCAVFYRTLASRRQSAENFNFLRSLERNPPLISVLIPAYNEAENILPALSSLFAQTYRNLEIIVIDDGSTDNTKELCAPARAAGQIIYLRNELRCGKSSSLNRGFYRSRGEYIVTIDADTVLDPDAIKNILKGFADPLAGAVSGNIRVGNANINLLTRMQAIHYLLTISAGRAANAGMDMLLIVSGAFGAYRREFIASAGGWDAGPGEDIDLTLKGRTRGIKIAFAADAVCRTNVPAKFSSYIRQQLRWESSLIFYCGRKFNIFSDIFSTKRGNFLAACDILIFQIIMSYSFFLYLLIIFNRYSHLVFIILFTGFLFYLILNAVQLLIAFIFVNSLSPSLSPSPLRGEGRGEGKFLKREGNIQNNESNFSLFLYLPLYCLFNAFFLRFIRVWAYTEELFRLRSSKSKHVPRKVLLKMTKW